MSLIDLTIWIASLVFLWRFHRFIWASDCGRASNWTRHRSGSIGIIRRSCWHIVRLHNRPEDESSHSYKFGVERNWNHFHPGHSKLRCVERHRRRYFYLLHLQRILVSENFWFAKKYQAFIGAIFSELISIHVLLYCLKVMQLSWRMKSMSTWRLARAETEKWWMLKLKRSGYWKSPETLKLHR